jgi:Fe-S cluster assembly ATP-binding protein|tara:strand:+ start:14747 stop:15487 length:741 start_codon:yes stop_codon:yes gene_type:complete
MLEIKNLHASINQIKILNGLNLVVKSGEIHAIMGTNGSGKSTFSKILTGHPAYTLNKGEILFEGKKLNKLSPEERSQLGIFLAFQYPVEIPGVSNEEFLRIAYNLKRKSKNLPDLNPIEFLEILKDKLDASNLTIDFLNRNVNEGFSGGEKKRNEILQMTVLDPKLAILDETDSGLDIDALRNLSIGINNFMNKEKSLIIITHYQRLLDYIVPDFIHIMHNGKIIKTGDASLALTLETKGYEWLIN